MYPPPELRSTAIMPGTMPMNASISAGLRRMSLVRSAALRSGLATMAAMRSVDSGAAPGAGCAMCRRRGGGEERRGARRA